MTLEQDVANTSVDVTDLYVAVGSVLGPLGDIHGKDIEDPAQPASSWFRQGGRFLRMGAGAYAVLEALTWAQPLSFIENMHLGDEQRSAPAVLQDLLDGKLVVRLPKTDDVDAWQSIFDLTVISHGIGLGQDARETQWFDVATRALPWQSPGGQPEPGSIVRLGWLNYLFWGSCDGRRTIRDVVASLEDIGSYSESSPAESVPALLRTLLQTPIASLDRFGED